MFQWIENPEHNFLESYIKYMSKSPTSNFQILDPSVLWLLWDFIQGHTSIKIKPNPPSSGFLGNIASSCCSNKTKKKPLKFS